MLNLRWNFLKNALKLYYFTISQERWNFPTDKLNLCWNFIRHVLKLYCFTFSQERLNFSTDELNLCWNFARNALQIFCFSGFLKIAETFLRMCWICAETLQELRWNFTKFQRKFSTCVEKFQRWNFSTDVLNLRWK